LVFIGINVGNICESCRLDFDINKDLGNFIWDKYYYKFMSLWETIAWISNLWIRWR